MRRILIRWYYEVKPWIPRYVQVMVRRQLTQAKRKRVQDWWPIEESAGKVPKHWPGWPGGKRFALILTHDVESDSGQGKCRELMRIEKERGFLSSFNFVPERYAVSKDLREFLTEQGYEVGVHDLKHDGKLYKSKESFFRKAERINRYLEEWNAVGFRSGAMHHNLEWIHALNVRYDASTFDTDPFEPQPDGIGTIFPSWIRRNGTEEGYVELPYTLPQDFTLFVLLQEKNVDIWKRKLDWIVERGGMALLNTHPDYMDFGGRYKRYDAYPVARYIEFLDFVRSAYKDRYWNALPKDLASYIAERFRNKPHPIHHGD